MMINKKKIAIGTGIGIAGVGTGAMMYKINKDCKERIAKETARVNQLEKDLCELSDTVKEVSNDLNEGIEILADVAESQKKEMMSWKEKLAPLLIKVSSKDDNEEDQQEEDQEDQEQDEQENKEDNKKNNNKKSNKK